MHILVCQMLVCMLMRTIIFLILLVTLLSFSKLMELLLASVLLPPAFYEDST